MAFFLVKHTQNFTM